MKLTSQTCVLIHTYTSLNLKPSVRLYFYSLFSQKTHPHWYFTSLKTEQNLIHHEPLTHVKKCGTTHGEFWSHFEI